MPGKSLDAFPAEKFPALKKLIFLNKKTLSAAILINGTCRKSHCLSNPNFHAAAGSLSSFIGSGMEAVRLAAESAELNGLPVCSSGL